MRLNRKLIVLESLREYAMHFITIDDQDFPELLELFNKSMEVGHFTKDGKVQIVKANNRLVMVSPGMSPETIAVKPVRTQDEALSVARRLLALGSNTVK